jgi:hypothetical protein
MTDPDVKKPLPPQPSPGPETRSEAEKAIGKVGWYRRLRAAHRNWFRPILIGVAATVAGGLILAAVLALVTRGGSSSPPSSTSTTSALASFVVGSVASFEARDSTKGRPFAANQVPVDPDDKVVFRVGLHNKSGRDLSNVVITPNWDPTTLVNATLSFSASDGNQTYYDGTVAQLSFDPANAVGFTELDNHSFRLLNQHLRLIRKIAPDVHHNGSYSDDIRVGSLARNATVYVTFVADVGRNREVTQGQLASGTLIAVRDISTPARDYTSNYYVAKPGQTLVVSVMLFNTGYSPVLAPSIRLTITKKQGFAVMVARITPGGPYSGSEVTSLPFTINYVGDEPLTLRYVPGSTYAYHCPRARCTANDYTKTQLLDGIVQGGIEAANGIGVGDKGKNEKNVLYVDFHLRVVRG